MVRGKNILIGITGGIAAYKICELIRLFQKNGANVKAVMTPAALKFVTPLTLETLTGNKVFIEQFANVDKKPEHIALCDWADVFVIAPASANTIGKIANGIADNLLTSLACAFKKPFVLAPAMNTGMWENHFVQQNISRLKNTGFKVVEPEEGFLACGTNGTGRLAAIEKIYDAVNNIFSEKKYLLNKKIIITAGGTKENIDPVRYIGNYSSGKMGEALADRAYELGAEVVLISSVDFCKPYKVINTATAKEMSECVKKEFQDADSLIMAAAVADYRPVETAAEKIKKEDTEELTLRLVKNPDILSEMCKIKKDNQIVVGFCAESRDLEKNAREKIQRKGCDFIAANDISRKDIAFSSDYNEMILIDKKLDIRHLKKDTKKNIASELLELIYDKDN